MKWEKIFEEQYDCYLEGPGDDRLDLDGFLEANPLPEEFTENSLEEWTDSVYANGISPFIGEIIPSAEIWEKAAENWILLNEKFEPELVKRLTLTEMVSYALDEAASEDCSQAIDAAAHAVWREAMQ